VEVAVTIPFFAPARRLRARAEWLHRWSCFAARVVGIHQTTRGSPPDSGLLVCNHLSYLDIIVLSSIRPCVFVAKRDIAAWPLFGWLTRAAGAIFVDRERRLDAGDVVVQMKEAIQAGVLVVLFPEGTSSDGATVLPFKPSLLEPAAQLECEITAARISYSLPQGSVADEICYWGDMTLVPHLLNVFTKPQINAQVAFAPYEVNVPDRKQIAHELHGAVLALRSAQAL
jgi:1-acyl-sn-glycerol-3-phosphate acyltransferase